MELNNFFSLVVGVISFAVILYISDLVVTRIFSRLDDDLAESNFDEKTKRKKINLIIVFSIVILIGMIVLVNIDIEIPTFLDSTEKPVLLVSQTLSSSSSPTPTPIPEINSDIQDTQKTAEETAKARS